MAYHDDLLQRALGLVHKNSVAPTQVALFPLLISETVSHWNLPSSRDALGRMFEHSPMKRVSARLSNSPLYRFAEEDEVIVQKLEDVAYAFVQLQGRRRIADYDNTTFWTSTEALWEFDKATEAFARWRSIQHGKIAQDYLVSLLIKPRDLRIIRSFAVRNPRR